MTFIQPTLVFLVTVLLLVYFARYRTKLRDRILILTFVAVAIFFIVSPSMANVLAQKFGVGRGVDLLLYLSAPGFAFLLLLILARLRQFQEQLTELVRAQALLNAREPVPGPLHPSATDRVSYQISGTE